MAKERDLYKEAIADSKKLKEAALKNGYRVLADSFKDVLKETVEAELNEEASCEDEEGDMMDESIDDSEDGTMSEGFGEEEDIEMEEDDDGLDLELGDEDEEEGDEDEMADLDESAGFNEADLHEVLRQVLDEVEHPPLGEMEEISPDQHDTGLMDQDSKEAGWEEKTPPAKKDWTMKEALYKRKVAALVLENMKLKKGLANLRETYGEVELFNRKLFYVNKLLDLPVVRENKNFKKSVIKQLDSAQTVKEAESIYKSLNMAVGLVSESVSAPRKGKKTQSLSEALGSHSKNERGVSSVRNDHLLAEGDAKFSVRRMQQLAGLIQED